MSDNEQFVGRLKILCSFCGGQVTLGMITSEQSALVDKGTWAGAHTMPVCAKFLELPLDEWMVQNRRGLGIPDPPDDGSVDPS